MQSPGGNSGVSNVDSVVGTWWVAQVKLSQEKRLADELSAADVAFYLPLVRRNRSMRGKIEPVQTPLFPTYLFFAGGEFVRLEAVKTHRTVAILPIVNQAKFIRQLREIQIAIDLNPRLGLIGHTPTGSRARVVRGAFLGAEGIVEGVTGNTSRVRLILRLDVLGKATPVEIPSEFIESID